MPIEVRDGWLFLVTIAFNPKKEMVCFAAPNRASYEDLTSFEGLKSKQIISSVNFRDVPDLHSSYYLVF